MARHHRHAVHAAPSTQVQPAAAPAEAAAEAPAAERMTLGWRAALTVWALGFGGLMLYELAGFVIRSISWAGR